MVLDETRNGADLGAGADQSKNNQLGERVNSGSNLSPSISQGAIEGLPALVDRAAKSLASARTSAEVLESRDMASFAYDAAKATARLAKAKGAHDTLIAATHRAQADALEIEAGAKRRLADEYDAAQERGEVRAANERTASKAEAVGVAEIGITHKEIHEARIIRDAEIAEPGIVRRTVDDALAAGEEPTRAKIRRVTEELRAITKSPEGRRAIKQVAKEVRAKLLAEHHSERQQKLEIIAARNPQYPCGRLFSLVLIDVPRHHNAYSDDSGSEKAPENHFPTLSFRELCDFPINNFAAPDSIMLFWSTAASLVDDLDIIAEWGFVSLRRRDENGKLLRDAGGDPLAPVGDGRYGSHQIWRKVRNGKQTGMGRWFWDQHEILIAARRGNVNAPLPGTQDQSVFDAPIGVHSAKPHGNVRAWVDRCWPMLTKVEVFARGLAPAGWVFWGNQAINEACPK